MQNFVVIDDSDDDSTDDIQIIDENDKLLKDLSKSEVICMFDGFQVPPPHWGLNDAFPLFLNEAIRDEDAFLTNTVIRDSSIPHAGKGLFTDVAVPKGHEYPYNGVLRLVYEGHSSDEDVYYGSLKHRSVEPMLQPFEHLGIRIVVVGSLNSAATYMNDLDHGLEEPPTHTANNCIIVGMPFDEINTMTVGYFKDWLRNSPVRIETIDALASGVELLTSYLYRCTVQNLNDDASSDNDRASDSDWEP